MRCRNTQCIYNEDYYCRQPDYVSIDENGECDQMHNKPPQSPGETFEEEDDS